MLFYDYLLHSPSLVLASSLLRLDPIKIKREEIKAEILRAANSVPIERLRSALNYIPGRLKE